MAGQMDYATLVADKATRGSIRSWLNYDPLPAEDILADAQAWLYGALRVREMLDSATVPVQDGEAFAPLPEGYREAFRVTDQGTGRTVQEVDAKQLPLNRTPSPGAPVFFAIYGERVNLDRPSAGPRLLDFLYYRAGEPLGPDHQTNALTDRYRHLLRAACLMVAADYRDDTETHDRQAAKLQGLVQTINAEAKLGGPAAMLESAILDQVDFANPPHPRVLADAESYIYTVLRTREMKALATVELATGEDSAPVPDRYLSPLNLTDPTQDGGRIIDVGEEQLPQLRRPGTGAPLHYAVYEDSIRFDVASDVDRDLDLVFYRRPAPLGPGNPSNWLTERYPALLRSAMLMQAALQRGDAQAMATHKQATDDLMQRIMLDARGEEAEQDIEAVILKTVDWGRLPHPAILADAESYVWGFLRIRDMMRSVQVPVAQFAATAPLPDGYLESIRMDDTGAPRAWGEIRLVSETQLEGLRDYDRDGVLNLGDPCHYAVLNGRFEFDCRTTVPLTYTLTFFGRPPKLSPLAPKNVLTERYPAILRAACLMFAARLKDEPAALQRAAAHKALCDELLVRANIEADHARMRMRHYPEV